MAQSMSYSIEEQIGEMVVPELERFLKTKNWNPGVLASCIRSIMDSCRGRSDRIAKIFIEGMFGPDEDDRLGQVLERVLSSMTGCDFVLKKIVYEHNGDIITEEFGAAIKEG